MDNLFDSELDFSNRKHVLNEFSKCYLGKKSKSFRRTNIFRLLKAIPASHHVYCFSEFLPGFLDEVCPKVFTTSMADIAHEIDWEWLRDQARELWKQGERYPAVIVNSAAEVCLGALRLPEVKMLRPLVDINEEVYFSSESHGGATAVLIRKWSELANQEIK